MSQDNIFRKMLGGDADGIPLVTSLDLEELRNCNVPDIIPIMPLRNTVMFPEIVIPVSVGRTKSLRLVNECVRRQSLVGVITQTNEDVEDPSISDLHKVGVVSKILKRYNMPDGGVTIIIQGVRRFILDSIVEEDPYLMGHVTTIPNNDREDYMTDSDEFKATVTTLGEVTAKCIKLSGGSFPIDSLLALKDISSTSFLVNFIASNLQTEVEAKQRILEESDLLQRAKMTLKEQYRCLQMEELKLQIQDKTKVEMDKQQKEYMLNQQLKVIQDELGDQGSEQALQDLRKKAEKKHWNAETAKQFEREIGKLERLHPMSPDYTVQLNYLELFVDLPWNSYSPEKIDLDRARKVLDRDHYGLDKIKERIIEHLAVLKLKGDMKAPILCLVGPPGVGKTSLGKSVAAAMGRKYIRMSLGGLHDESEIRGHRKTYIGAMPGRIIQLLRKAGTANPVFVLDEIDKISGMTVQGDPSSAMLEVLDPEQNSTFYDNYLETTFDLSKVMFIATANTLSTIHPALVDRMEVIEISSYLQQEKLEIAKRHLVPRQIVENGLKKRDISFSDEILDEIISQYTREAGVRVLEKQIAKVVRHQAYLVASGKEHGKKLSSENLKEVLGVPLHTDEEEYREGKTGVAVGLAWTPVGGDVLYVETACSDGKGGLTLTGNLGDVMKESATIAFEYIKANAAIFNLNSNIIKDKDVYVHVPEGAIPKDGPSAGITILTALVSLFTGRPMRPQLAMTGEITLRGRLTPIGGLKEKALAAKRVGITDIVLSKDNEKDVQDIEPRYIEGLNFHYFTSMIDAVKFNLDWK
ncbi:MAG: endopeptidase La [Bacteroidales bacterium]|nr:endopeptidase La [Bacteroidales bacterium]